VDQSTEDGSAADPLVVEVSNGRLGSGRVKVQGPVGRCPVVVGDVIGQHEAQVSFTHDEHAVGDLAPYGAHPTLGKAFARGHPAATRWLGS
jgi:hypothetical protein